MGALTAVSALQHHEVNFLIIVPTASKPPSLCQEKLTLLSLCRSMMKDASLGIHYTEIGALTSIMPIAYGERFLPKCL